MRSRDIKCNVNVVSAVKQIRKWRIGLGAASFFAISAFLVLLVEAGDRQATMKYVVGPVYDEAEASGRCHGGEGSGAEPAELVLGAMKDILSLMVTLLLTGIQPSAV